jgi:carbon monoxide dehydrogenase subunit G
MSTKLYTTPINVQQKESIRPVATIRRDISISAPPAYIWAVLRDVGAVHQRLLPGRVAATRMEGDDRFLTFPDGRVIRERIIAVDDSARRLVYGVVDGARTEYHRASFEVHPDGGHAGRLVWTTEVLPDTLATETGIRMERAAAEMKQAIEAAATR